MEAITSVLEMKDVLVISGTGSGKSLCYQIPSVMRSGITILVVPTMALRQDQVDYLNSQNIKAFAIGQKGNREDFLQSLEYIKKATDTNPIILVGTPESLLGHNGLDGFVRRNEPLLLQHLRLVAIDECHLLYEWEGFRTSFREIVNFKRIFPSISLLALTATLLPTEEQLLVTELLHCPKVYRSPMDRINISLDIDYYNPPLGKPGDDKWKESWELIVQKFAIIADGKLTIIYFSYVKEAETACSFLLQNGIKAAVYTGDSTTTDKKHVHSAMQNGEIKILCATTAYGCGLNIKSIRCVIRFGLPKNISIWMQEQGRAGRDQNQSKAVLLFNECYDLHRCVYWTKELGCDAKKRVLEDFAKVIKYIYAAFSGKCIRKEQLSFFGESCRAESSPCCSSCNAQYEKVQGKQDLTKLFDTFSAFEKRGIYGITESHVLNFLVGKSDKYLAEKLDSHDFDEYPCQSICAEKKKRFSALLRQSVAYGMLDFELRELFFGGRKQYRKYFFLTGSVPNCELPNLFYESRFISFSNDSGNNNYGRKKISGIVDNVVKLIESTTWKEATLSDLKFIGYTEKNETVIYVKNCDILDSKTSDKHKNSRDPALGFIQLTLKSSAPPTKKTIRIPRTCSEETELLNVTIHVNPCAGVKMCSGEGCTVALQNFFTKNNCLTHQGSHLVQKTCKCKIVLVKPIDYDDRRRWVLAIGPKVSPESNAHSHSRPPENRLTQEVRKDIAKTLDKDPNITVAEIHKGVGLDYIPAEKNLAAANLERVRKVVKSNSKLQFCES